MPAGPGESLLSTVYADIHYLFRLAAPSQPQQQRFAKGSYVYLYHSPHDGRAKLEIANHAGTPDQDAFYGYLDAVQSITHSANQPGLCTIILEQARINTQSEWHLATWDERNEKRWLHKLHTVNVYFWSERAAVAFVEKIRSIVSPEKLNFGPMPAQIGHEEHRNSMSPVVQQLERTAIGSPYHPRAGSTTSTQSLPGPPTPASTISMPAQPNQAAYNPAAPANPEPIAHREKTPPPVDGASGTGLSHVARYDQQPQQQFANYTPQNNAGSLQSTPQSSYFPGQPQSTAMPPPPALPQQHQQPAPSPPVTQYAAYPSSSAGYGPSITSPSPYNQQPPTPSAPPAYGTHTPLQSPGLPPPPPQMHRPPQQQQQPQAQQLPPAVQAAQIAGFSAYSYNPSSQVDSTAVPGQYNQHGAFVGNVHQQLYRPTQEEADHMSGHHGHGHAQTQPGLGDKYRVSERLNQVEKGVAGFLKKLDKKF